MTAEWKGPTLVVVWGRVGGGGRGSTHFSEAFIHEKVSSSQYDELSQQDGKSHARDQRDKAITCVFCRDLH